MSSNDVLRCGAAVCGGYSQLFEDLCKLANIQVVTINGFAKGYGYKNESKFKYEDQADHAWNAVYILDNWYLIDSTWGTGNIDSDKKFVKKLDEHYFLTDPEELIWTHFPFDKTQNNYDK